MKYQLQLGEALMTVEDEGIVFTVSAINFVNFDKVFSFQVLESDYTNERIEKLHSIITFIKENNTSNDKLVISYFSEGNDSFIPIFEEKFKLYEYVVKQEHRNENSGEVGPLTLVFQVLIHGIDDSGVNANS